MKATRPANAVHSDDEVRRLLQQHKCPVPFHEVRTRFLGNIASPTMSASPLETVKGLWSGELPEFASMDEANELLEALVMGLWNRLTRHQERNSPFRLVRFDVPATPEGLGQLALTRRQELEGFVEGLFGGDEELDLPERAHHALTRLADIRAMYAGMILVAEGNTTDLSPEITALLQRSRELTKISEHEIHEAVLACTRARRQALSRRPTAKPILH